MSTGTARLRPRLILAINRGNLAPVGMRGHPNRLTSILFSILELYHVQFMSFLSSPHG